MVSSFDAEHGEHLSVKHIAYGDILLAEEGSCSLTAVVQDLDNLVVVQQGVEALHLQLHLLLLHVKAAAPLTRPNLQYPYWPQMYMKVYGPPNPLNVGEGIGSSEKWACLVT